jgi:iron complex transport system substrate-binding protein
LPAPPPTTSIVQLRADAIRSYQRANFLGVNLSDLGFTRPDSQNVDDFGQDYGQESLADFANGEFVIVAVVNLGSNAFADETLASPLWEHLPAVQSGNLLEVDSSHWIGGIGYGAAFEILDVLEAYFAS